MRSDGVSETISRQPSEVAGATAIRRLAYSDLPAVISIERRSFPAPWSLAMFVLELSKPSGICLAATDGDELLGYLVCSRYDQVWHLMNVAVAPERRRAGVARGLISRLLEEAGRQAALHARGAGLQPAGDRDVRAARLPLGRGAPSLLPGQRRGRADHVAGLSWPVEGLPDDPRDRDLLRRHLRRGPRRAARARQHDLLAGRGARPVRRRRARGRLAPPPRADRAGRRGGPGGGGRHARRHRGRRGDRRPGPDRGPAGRRQHGEGDRRAAPAAADPGRPPAGPRRRQLPRARAARAALPLPRRQRRPHAARRGARPRRPRGARPDPRRRGRRGLRQGRAPARARLPGRPGAGEAGARGRSRGVRDAGGDEPRPRPRLQLQRPEDGARLPLPRPRPGGRRASAAPTSPRASRPPPSASSSPSWSGR